jgi:hypothetical protein
VSTGYLWAIGPCFGCQQLFGFDPDRVPSVRVNDIREPVCRNCVERANPRRIANGLDPIVPLPGAYVDEEDLVGHGVREDEDY